MIETLETDILTLEIKRIIEKRISTNSCNKQQEKVFDALRLLLNGDYEKYTFSSNIINSSLFCDYSDNTSFQILLSKINEKQNGRQESG
ncbi:MAG: hypothetical protein ACK5L7_01040, partial [Paludibacteraceae bacterium]